LCKHDMDYQGMVNLPAKIKVIKGTTVEKTIRGKVKTRRI